MTTPWSPAQIAAVAPDPASLTAARGLTSRWIETGLHGPALWGSCRGSGTEPYRTEIDLTGPAYRCSCPSRKFPCKHALSLLERWSSGAVPAADPPDSVTRWLDTRRARAAAPEADDPHPTTVRHDESDSAASQRRAERAAAGLDELDRWLTDRIRSGLGAVDHGYGAYEAMAARMVDAQVPGVAAALRSLPPTVSADPHWPSRVLAEYGRLHLLVQAYRSVAELPEPLARSVRAHLGFPTRVDEVRAQPPVRDIWYVLGTRISDDNRIFTRKTWMRGRDSDRWAIVLDFAHGTPRFAGESPVAGTAFDADLHFYPAAAPLRAHVGTRHGPAVPLVRGTGVGFDEALGDYADALAANPWLRTWPMVLDSVVPTRSETGWLLVDGEGRALPVAADDDTCWTMVAVAGGLGITVCGDWNGRELEPVAVASADSVVVL